MENYEENTASIIALIATTVCTVSFLLASRQRALKSTNELKAKDR